MTRQHPARAQSSSSPLTNDEEMTSSTISLNNETQNQTPNITGDADEQTSPTTNNNNQQPVATIENSTTRILSSANNNNNRTTDTARRLSRIYRSSPVTTPGGSTIVMESLYDQQLSSGRLNHLDEDEDDDREADDESLSPPHIITSPSKSNSSSPNFKLNLSNVIPNSSMSSTQQASKTPRGRSVSAAVLPNSAESNHSSNSIRIHTPRSRNRQRQQQQPYTSPYYIPPPPTQSPRSILSSTPRTRSPGLPNQTSSSPHSALTPRQVTFELSQSFDNDQSSPSNNMPPHSANAILHKNTGNTETSPIFPPIFQTPPQSSRPRKTTSTSSKQHAQGLQIPQEKYSTSSNVGPKSPLAPSVYEAIFGVKQAIVFRHSYGNEFEGKDEEDNEEEFVNDGDLSFNHKSPRLNSLGASNVKTGSPQLTPRRLAQQVSSTIKAKLSPRNRTVVKEGFSGLEDESTSNSLENSTSNAIFTNDIGSIIVTSQENIIDVKSDDENSVKHVVVGIDMAEVIANAIENGLKPHHLQNVSGDSNNKDGTNLSVSPNFLLPNFESESSCQSPPTTSQLVISATANTIENKPVHGYSNSDLTTIVPGMLVKRRVSVGTDAEGKSVTSNHRRRQLKVNTCCGTIELSIFKIFSLGSLFVNILAFVWLAILLSIIFANQIGHYSVISANHLKSTRGIIFTTEKMAFLAKVSAYSSTCSSLLLKYENYTTYNETSYLQKFDIEYQSLMNDLYLSKQNLPSDIVTTLETSNYLGFEYKAAALIKQGNSLDALKLLESTEYENQVKVQKYQVVDPISTYFDNLSTKTTNEVLLLSLIGIIIVACVFAFVVPLFAIILGCAFNRDSVHLQRLNNANAVMLMDTMNNDVLRELFRKHCEYEYASENFTILEKINEYKKLCEKSFEIQEALLDIENNSSSIDLDISSPVKRKPASFEDVSPSTFSPMRRKQSSADNRESKRLKLFKKQYSEKDLGRIEQEKYEIAFEIFTDYLDVNGERSVNINKSLSDKVKEQMDNYAKGLIDFLSDNLFDIVEQEICIVLLDTHYRFKESLSFQKQMKIDKINKAKLVRKVYSARRSMRY